MGTSDSPGDPPDLSQRLRLANRLMAAPGDEPLTLSLTQGQVDWLKGLLAYDPATDAYGRAHFETLAAAEWARALRFGRELSFIVFRLRGREALPAPTEAKSESEPESEPKSESAAPAQSQADSESRVRILRALVEVTRGVLRDGGDALGRLDALEFAVLLPDTGAAGARDVVSRMITAFDSLDLTAAGADAGLNTLDLCSVTLSRPSVGEKGWRGALDAALRRLHAWPATGAARTGHLDILPAHAQAMG